MLIIIIIKRVVYIVNLIIDQIKIMIRYIYIPNIKVINYVLLLISQGMSHKERYFVEVTSNLD